jgi:hypothetical protein
VRGKRGGHRLYVSCAKETDRFPWALALLGSYYRVISHNLDPVRNQSYFSRLEPRLARGKALTILLYPLISNDATGRRLNERGAQRAGSHWSRKVNFGLSPVDPLAPPIEQRRMDHLTVLLLPCDGRASP